MRSVFTQPLLELYTVVNFFGTTFGIIRSVVDVSARFFWYNKSPPGGKVERGGDGSVNILSVDLQGVEHRQLVFFKQGASSHWVRFIEERVISGCL